jgi:hypothetical protein
MAGTGPQQMQELLEAGYNNPQAVLLLGVVCGLIIGAGAGAIGGAILAAARPD